MLAQGGVVFNFTTSFVNADPDNVAFSVLDDTGSVPVLLESPVQMLNVEGDVYRGFFTPLAGKRYIVFMAVYTDDTFTSFDGDFVQQGLAVVGLNLLPPVQSVIGVVDCNGGEI